MIAIRWNLNQNLNDIKIIGNRIVPKEEIKNIVTYCINSTSKEKLRLEQIGSEIQKHDYISKVIVTKENPQTIKIEIQEKQPIAILAQDSGKMVFIDKNCNVLPYRYIERQTSLPLVRGAFIKDSLDANYLQQAAQIINELSKEENLQLLNETSEIYFNRADLNWYIITVENGIQLIIGKAEELAQKFKNGLISLKYLTENSKKKFNYIDLRWSNQVITKL